MRSTRDRVPPLAALGAAKGGLDRRGVNLRWLLASALTGMTGAALLGGAIYVSLQGEITFAELPERSAVAARPQPSEGGANVARKGDRLVRHAMISFAKQSFRAPVTQRTGDREAIRVRAFVRVATNLAQTTGVYATDIPPFDPLRLFSEGAPERGAEPPLADAPDAEVSFVRRDLAEVAVEPGAPALGDDEVGAQVEEERRMAAEAGRRAALPIAPQLLLSRSLRPLAATGLDGFGAGLGTSTGPGLDASPFKSIDVRVVPENVTNLAKAENHGDGRASDAPLVEERDLALKRGETIELVLRANGAAPDGVRAIVAALGGRAKSGALAEGQQMRVQVAPHPRAGEGRAVTRVVLYGEGGIEAIAAMNDRGAYVSVAPPSEGVVAARPPAAAPSPLFPQVQDPTADEDESEGGVRLYDSLYETATRQELPRGTVEDLVRIFAYDVDFQRRVQPGDALELVYATDDEPGAPPAPPEIQYAAFTIAGEPHRVYRFQGADGMVEYFDEQGRSLKKFLLRKPVADGIMTSGFGYRHHPVLGYGRMHTGVDWANKIGTPIMAAGNGSIIKAEWGSGYGRRVEIQHANGYVTAYNHMSAFGRGVQAGTRVRQGQVIGYVGSTGLSTGAHVHYEVIVNGHFVDPMRIRVPRGRELDGPQLAEFKRQREQIDGVIARAGQPRTAQREAMR